MDELIDLMKQLPDIKNFNRNELENLVKRLSTTVMDAVCLKRLKNSKIITNLSEDERAEVLGFLTERMKSYTYTEDALKNEEGQDLSEIYDILLDLPLKENYEGKWVILKPKNRMPESIIYIESVEHWRDNQLFISGWDLEYILDKETGEFSHSKVTQLKDKMVDKSELNVISPEEAFELTRKYYKTEGNHLLNLFNKTTW